MKKLLLLSAIAAVSFAADHDKDRELAEKLVERSVTVFKEIQDVDDKAIPNEILENADGLIIMPSVKRAGFIFGGKFGKGVFIAKTANGWSAPSFIRLEGGSFGAQIGAAETDLILVIMNKEGVEQVAKTGVQLGGDVTAAAGPVGRTAQASTTPIPATGILSYSRSRGLFAGATVQGTTLRSDDDVNRAVYGPDVKQAEILSGNMKTPAFATSLQSLIAHHPTTAAR
jgi:lipid-binding SYLF domain-containing protein